MIQTDALTSLNTSTCLRERHSSRQNVNRKLPPTYNDRGGEKLAAKRCAIACSLIKTSPPLHKSIYDSSIGYSFNIIHMYKHFYSVDLCRNMLTAEILFTASFVQRPLDRWHQAQNDSILALAVEILIVRL